MEVWRSQRGRVGEVCEPRSSLEKFWFKPTGTGRLEPRGCPLLDHARSPDPQRSSRHAKQCSAPLPVKPHPQTSTSHTSPQNPISLRTEKPVKNGLSPSSTTVQRKIASVLENGRQPDGCQQLPATHWLHDEGRKLENPSEDSTGSPAKSGDLSI
jgi:hypothetical protein